jgi:nucleotide-binding universal stress UspA family protein
MNRIVLAVKAGAHQPWLADAAAQVARETEASVVVVSVDGLDLEVLSATPREEVQQRAREAAEAAAARIREQGVPVSAEVRSGPVVRGILVFAEEQGADLILAGASTRGRLAQRLLGTVPMMLIQRSRRPVLAISPPDAGQADERGD